MNSVSGKCINCNGDYEAGCNYCPNCDNCLNNSINKSISLSKPRVSDEVLQIVSVGVRPDNIYEAKMLLAPGVDMTSIKVTVKNKNLRVSVRRPCGEALINSSSIFKKPFLHDAEKIMTKHWGNFLLPDGIDGVKIRAVVDNKRRILQLVAPAINYSKVKKKNQ